ncbi:hypothetical protein KFL_008020060 [Klebsormidium nitens]|uniref:PDZ domain-containing protein n=1 Tax=Klebsormidium nitens TaxID=105231 RepID=A0A1Y1IS25_KLENI|nr:hypothetical protein KFL_008020060 [Klebsormidium nitens]|eukprot:GAQ91536.1 hypothetical protein KFL_008020060 [Klebsormidium nitens]
MWARPVFFRSSNVSVHAGAPGETVQVDPASLDAFLASLPSELAKKVYTVALQKPLGIYFKDANDGVVVDEVAEGGHADGFNKSVHNKTRIQSGDRLLATTAFPSEGQFRTQQPIVFPTSGEKFDTVIAAIQSNTCARCYITLVLEHMQS